MSIEKDFNKEVKKVYHQFALLLSLMMIVCCSLIYYILDPTFSSFDPDEDAYTSINDIDDRIEDGVHVSTGLKDGEGLMVVVNNCTNCHSSKLVTQNRMSRERWNATIRWMQETQNLWDLGDNQKVIVDYLVTNYPVQDIGRRANLSNVDWYELEN